ncbi:MAG: hypothetical protein A3H44_05995 [Gammaproteobacteria bacterium RIFCSPLOWO2_02_FULL_57_10]|nr:MAG: hypothetical protein A3H44_05995 [Gammaproteobacteria bacterium RIFCSPLOWO2_02_FULL_57_10]
MNTPITCTAFLGKQRIATGIVPEVATAVKKVIGDDANAPVILFNDVTSAAIEVDFRGSVQDVLNRLEQASAQPDTGTSEASEDATIPRGRGRPKLGVVSREVTLLPRHWDWLNSQPGGASVALRKLVEEARRVNGQHDAIRQAQNAAYRFMSTMASDQPEFEEAMRAFFASDFAQFSRLIDGWPADVRNHILKLSEGMFLSAN